ncbi:hypothetical protein H7X68_04015 [Candidatus Saccharibacteria bacterium]|nr:hypothetical protein [Candidatus Saccharibacteria bacterium]
MEKEIIESTVASIPMGHLGEIQQDNEIWEETDGGSHFKVTRHTIPVAKGVEMIAMSVSGEPNERARVIAEFCEVFGNPIRRDTLPEDIHHVDILAWLVK